MERRDIYTVGDLCNALAPLSLVRRQAIVFCLDSGIHPTETSSLTWRDALTRPLPGTAFSIVRKIPRHMRLNYVFWEYISRDVAAPIFNLASTLEEALKMTFEEAVAKYADMLYIDTYREAEEFQRDFYEA